MKKKLETFFDNQIEEHKNVLELCEKKLKKPFLDIVEICVSSLAKKKKILFFGNGGSAADAQHLSTEFTVRFSKNRKAIAAISLATDTSALTAIGNDFGFDHIFSRQIEALGEKNDVAIGISTSGKSQNVIEALQVANKMGLKCIAFTGKNTTYLDKHCHKIISIPAVNTARIQEMHIMLGQMLCNSVEFKLGYCDLVKEESL